MPRGALTLHDRIIRRGHGEGHKGPESLTGPLSPRGRVIPVPHGGMGPWLYSFPRSDSAQGWGPRQRMQRLRKSEKPQGQAEPADALTGSRSEFSRGQQMSVPPSLLWFAWSWIDAAVNSEEVWKGLEGCRSSFIPAMLCLSRSPGVPCHKYFYRER